MLFSVLALQPCINFQVFYINKENRWDGSGGNEGNIRVLTGRRKIERMHIQEMCRLCNSKFSISADPSTGSAFRPELQILSSYI